MGNFFSKNNNSSELLQRIQELEEELRESKNNRVPLQRAWRDIGYYGFSEKTKIQLLNKIGAIDPPCDVINLVVIGQIYSGKSSYINTLTTVLRDSGRISTIQNVYGQNFGSTTTKLFEVTLKKFGGRKRLRIYDCRGFHTGTFRFHDLPLVISGHIKKNYEFKKDRKIDKDDSIDAEFYNPNPTITDQMHGILIVADVEKLDCEETEKEYHQIMDDVPDCNVPSSLILTKVDTLELCNAGSLNEIFRSKHAEKKVDTVKNKFGFHDCQIWPIANYVTGINQDITRDILALLSLDNILEEALTYIENQL